MENVLDFSFPRLNEAAPASMLRRDLATAP